MTLDPKDLRAKAEAATPGPWRYGVDIDQLSDGGKGFPLDYYPDCRTVVEISCRECGERSDIAEQDAAFIAAANPQTVIALLDDLARTRAALEASYSALRSLRIGDWEIGYVNERVDRVLALAKTALENVP